MSESEKLSELERRIRLRASLDNHARIKKAIEDLTQNGYRGRPISALTYRYTETDTTTGESRVVQRPPTIQEVGSLLVTAISEAEKNLVENKAIGDFLARAASLRPSGA